MDKLKNIAEGLDVILICTIRIFMIGFISLAIILIILLIVVMVISAVTNTPLNIEFMRLL